MLTGPSLLTTMLGLAGMLLGLAILVQVIQEAWKYLWSTKSSAYERALFQFIGPWTRQLTRTGLLADLQVNGPFQLWRGRPHGRLMPLEKAELVEAMERTAPAWIRRSLETLRVEAQAMIAASPDAPPTPALRALVAELQSAERGSPGYATSREVLRFLEEWGVHPDPKGPSSPPVNASALTPAFRERFLPHVTAAERTFPQLQSNFEYIYKRRNTLLTIVFAIAVALLGDLPVSRLYEQAAALSAEEATALAESMTRLYDSIPAGTAVNDSLRARAELLRTQAIEILNQRAGLGLDPELGAAAAEQDLQGTLGRFRIVGIRVSQDGPLYLLECLLTALLISFGAPFWNDLAGTFLRLQRGSSSRAATPTTGTT